MTKNSKYVKVSSKLDSKSIKVSSSKNKIKSIFMSFDKLIGFLQEARMELNKVVWPSRRQVITSTISVLSVVVIISSFLGITDFILIRIIGFLIK